MSVEKQLKATSGYGMLAAVIATLLAIAGLTLYQPKLICRKTHGIVAHDHYWIRYADDPTDLSYASLMQEMSKAVKAVPGDTPSQRHIG